MWENYYLNAHVDDDFFYSLTTIASDCGLQEQSTDVYNMYNVLSIEFTSTLDGHKRV